MGTQPGRAAGRPALTLQLFLNDLSLADDDCTFAVAVERLRGLVRTLRAVERVSRGYLLTAGVPFAAISFGRGFPLAALRNDAGCTEERVFLKTVADRSPWDAALAQRPPDAAGGAEYMMPATAPVRAGADAVALGLAHDLDGLAVSVPTHALWDGPTVAIERITLDEHGGLVQTPVEARNAASEQHVDARAAELRRAGLPAVHDGAELWARRAEILPNLAFVPTVRAQVEGLHHADPNLDGALECLVGIDGAVGDWKRDATAHPTWPFNVRPESRSRREAGLADIKDATGVTRRFSDHASYGPDENRVHFILETEPERRALVGHVGRKLGIG